ncbi:hypothetical protein [Spirochaeta isovalerica]|uniref:Tetratricopeptide repeat protein n=1 Tax=Spirochaeta isovalerica TaxID=150 RepID=A0A841R578_9SPIO|nr:hypothetical protein [Spirochaeta isovalerica]MBB6480314.1 hypothetical protein [Spirochaeta isovalerica]
MRRKIEILLLLSLFTFPVISAEPTERQLEGYHELLVLFKIDPAWPGLEDLIHQAEVIIGIAPEEISPENAAKCKELYDEASIILNTLKDEDIITYKSALNLLNEAIKLNPTNKEAKELREEILQKIPSDNDIIISQNLLAEYKKAENEYLTGNIYICLQIIQKYETDETMMSYAPFRKLRQLVYRELGLSGENE